MFQIPGFDPKTLSDEQLYEKSLELSHKINWAVRFSSGGADMLIQMQQAIDYERRERQFMENWKIMAPHLNDTIETEPDLRQNEDAPKLGKDKSPAQRRRPRYMIPTPTPRPDATPMNQDGPSPSEKATP